MGRIFKILAGVIYLCSYVSAQTKYDPQPVSQKVQYDDDEPSYHQEPKKYDITRSPSIGEYEQYGEQHAPVYYKPVSSPYPQHYSSFPNSPLRHASYHPQNVAYASEKPTRYQSNEPAYHKENDYNEPDQKHDKAYDTSSPKDPKSKAKSQEQPEELQYSHEPEEPTYYLPSAAPVASPYPAVPYQPGHPSNHYPAPATSYQPAAVSYQPSHLPNQHPSSAPETSYQPAAVSYQPSHHPNQHPSSAPETPYQPAAASYQPGQHYPSAAPETSYPDTSKPYQQQTSLVKRDPKLPLYFTMYEKRIIQDPTDKYGKGPWRYLTYGHGITYGSKEPGKVFEKGYGYIRALGRDHCKLPENQCPPRDDKPFEYDGRKEPYFGYRPH